MDKKTVSTISLDNIDLYSIDYIYEKYNTVSSTLFIRKDVIDDIIVFQNEKYLNKENFEKYMRLAYIETYYYPLSTTIKLLNINNSNLNNVEELLSTLIENISHINKTYYLKEKVDEFIKIFNNSKYPNSLLLSMVYNENIIYAYDFIKYYNQNKCTIFDIRNLTYISFERIFNNDELVNIYNNKCIKDDIINISNIISNKQSFNHLSLFENIFIKDKYKKNTYDLMKEFYITKMNLCKSNNLYRNSTSYINTLFNLYKIISKEIYLYSSNELYKLLLSNKNTQNKIITQFLQYVNDLELFSFKENINFSFKNNYIPKNNDCYTEQEWKDFYVYLNNINKHIEKAYENRVYAEYWLIMMMYLTSALRISDILTINPLNFKNQDFYEKYFLKTNPLTISESQIIVNFYRDTLKTLTIQKTGERKHFYIHLPLVESMATAICICEYHRYINDDNFLFTNVSLDSNRIKEKFEDIPIDFKTTKATKTLLSLMHNIAENNTNINNAYTLVSNIRSHKNNGDKYSETTSIYLQQANLQEDLEIVAYNICSRGVFGWLYLAMISYANGNIKSLEDATNEIDKLKQQISPQALENVADFLNNEEQQRKYVLKELSNYTRNDIMNFLTNIGSKFTTTCNNTISCIKGKYCIEKSNEKCLFCPYAIPTTYTLEVLNNKLIQLIDEIEHLPIENTIQRKKNTLYIQKILLILKEAKLEFDKYDKNFIKSFVELETIQQKLNSIPNNKFLLIENSKGK